jgi:branched-chain amino acid transport system substrate-binding protein
VIGHEHLTKGQTDYKALLTKAHALAPNVVFYGGTTATGGGLLRKQMADAGLKTTPYIGGDGISDAEFFKTAGDMANNSYYTVAAPETSKLTTATAFVAAYRNAGIPMSARIAPTPTRPRSSKSRRSKSSNREC